MTVNDSARKGTDDEQHRLVTDGGIAPDLTDFQVQCLTEIARIDDEPYGLAIKRALEAYYGSKQNHGRVYPNLDELVERGLVEKWEIDRRTNGYGLTSDGVRVLEARLDRLSGAVDAHHAAVTDGGIDTTRLRLGPERATEPYGEVLDAARARLDEDDPDMIFLVTARVGGQTKSSHLDGPKAWTGATVGKRPALMRPGEISDADLADELVEHILATLLLETEYGGADLAHKLAEIETAMGFTSAGGEA